jgi:hypothetical protein
MRVFAREKHKQSSLLLLLLLCSFLLHGLMFGKPQSHSLGQLDVPIGALLDAGDLVRGQRLGPESTNAIVKATIHHTVVHTAIEYIMDQYFVSKA